MFYRTRVMVAAVDFLHGADLLRKGDTFVATPIDADYLHSHGRATFAPEQPAAAPKVEAAAPAPAPAPVPATPPAVENVETPNTATTDSSESEALQDAGAAESSAQAAAPEALTETAAPSAEAAAPATGRRRGRAAQNTASE